MKKINDPTARRTFFKQMGMMSALLPLGFSQFMTSCRNSPEKAARKAGDRPLIMVCFSWSHSNIGDIGITPGLLRLLKRHIPEAEVVLVANTKAEETREYIQARFPECKVVRTPFSRAIKENTAEFKEAFDRADLVLYNSGTTLSFGRWDYDWNRTMPLAMPLFMAREAGKPYGIYCQSFEKFAWPSDQIFVPLLSDAAFLFARDGNSLDYLKSLGIKPPVLEYGPDATFAFDQRDESAAGAFMQKYDLKSRQFITITIRTSIEGFIDKVREEAHAAKLRELIELWVKRTGHDVLICPEVNLEIEPARELIFKKLPGDVLSHVRFKDEWWLPDEAFVVYANAEAIVSMEMHSIILGLAAGTPVIHPRFEEAGRKAWMLRDLGIEEWLFDIDRDGVEEISRELFAIHNDLNTALGKVQKALDFISRRQQETMQVVRNVIF